MNGSSMTAGRGVLLGFILFYAALFGAFGCFSPFLPAFLAERGLRPEQLGVVLGAATVLRLVCGPIGARLADRFHFLRAELAACAVLGAGAALLYLAAQGFWTIMAVSLLQAAALAPLVPLADALSLAHARPRPNKQAFEYGWVRGVGSAAFVAGTLAAGQATSSYGLSATLWLSAAGLLTVPIAAGLVPAFPGPAASQLGQLAHRPWLTLLRQRAFVWVILIAALILGSHAMYDSFAVIRWMQAGISPAATAALWSESVAAEVVVFFFLGPRLLRALSPAGALAVAAVCGLVRWGVLAETVDAVVLGLVQPLHGFTLRCSISQPCASSPIRCRATSRPPHRPSTAWSRPGAPPRFCFCSQAGFTRVSERLVFGAWRRFAWRRFPSSGGCIGRSRRPRARAKRADY
jgi:PPP family 3-phenylpropionic acid transporter